MPDRGSDDRSTRVASGFPRPEDVPGPTERLRELHRAEDTEPREPAFGRVSVGQAGTEDHVDLDTMINVSGKAADATFDGLTSIVNRIAEQTTRKLREELDAHDVPARARQAGLGIGELGTAGVAGVAAAGALTTAMIAGLSRIMPVWGASLITAGMLGTTAAGLAIAGRRQVAKPLQQA